MNTQLAIRILVNAGYIVNCAPEGDMIAVELPNRSVRVAEVQAILAPYNNLVTFYQAYDVTQVFFD